MKGTYTFSQNAIVKIEKIVSDYREGLLRIDREFDAACDRLDQSITNLHGGVTKYGKDSVGAQQQERNLRQHSNSIELEIARTISKIAEVNRGIAAVESDIRALGNEKSSLEQQISDRWLIEKIYYYLAEENDAIKKRCHTLQMQLDSSTSRKSALEQAKHDFEAARQQAEARKTELQNTLEETRYKIAALNKTQVLNKEQAQTLADEKKQANANREKRKMNWLSIFANEWKKTTAEIDQGFSYIQRQQPPFADFDQGNTPAAPEVPSSLILGSQQVSCEKFCFTVPHLIPFPLPRALAFSKGNAAQKRLVHHLLLRLLSVLPPGQLELTLIDPLQLGQSVAPFLPLLTVAQLVPQQRVLTRANEIEAALGKLTDEVEELIQHRFNDKAPTWSEYNANNPDNPLRYKVIVLFDGPEQLSDKSLWFIERLCENGSRCGVLPIIATSERSVKDGQCDKLYLAVHFSSMPLDDLLRGPVAGCGELSFTYQPEQWPQQDLLNGFISTLATAYAEKARFSKSMPELWTDFAKGETTLDGFNIPIGWTPAGETVSLILGALASEHHALLAGKTGSGKTNLLHVMIHALCEKYAPGEVDLYLLDYKESTEFTVYANPPLPHARLVATESDPEYGVTVLKHLADELVERSRIFKAVGVSNFAEYRNVSRKQLPRILLVIDEFQVLFSERRQAADAAAEQLLSQLLKQGRSFGIHILLATQTLKGINALSIGALITQLGCRIALACGQEDSAMILGGNNWAAADLRSPPEAIINNANGAKSGNVKFLIPLAESTFCRRHIAKLSERAAQRGVVAKTRIFTGGNLPEMPSFDKYRAICGQTDVLLLGEKLTFNADAMTVPLIRRSAFNVLFSGYNDPIHDGLLASTLFSIAFTGGFDEVVYFNGRGVTPDGGFAAAARILDTRFKAFDKITELPLQEILKSIGSHRVALIIDGLDSEKALHPSPAFRTPKPNEALSPADLLKQIVEEGPRKGTFVLTFVDKWPRCSGTCKELLSFFELRVGYCMNEDDAGSLVIGGIGKFKGIEKPNRAVFLNRMTNDPSWFRSYIHGIVQ